MTTKLHDWSLVCIHHPRAQNAFTFGTICMARISVNCGFTSSVPDSVDLQCLVFKVKSYVKKSMQ